MPSSITRRFRAVIFDLYDTLVWLDAPASSEARQRLAARLGVSLGQFNSEWRKTIESRMLGQGGTLADHLREAASGLGVAADPVLIAELVAMERHRLEECVHLYPNAVTVLERLRAQGFRLGLLSNVSDGAALPIAHLGIDRLFDDLVLSYQVGILKPDPAIFKLACRRLDVAPNETAFVADGGFGELDAARRLGLFTIKVEQENQSGDFGGSMDCDAKVGALTEVERLLMPSL